jgi:hypothetical protein
MDSAYPAIIIMGGIILLSSKKERVRAHMTTIENHQSQALVVGWVVANAGL